MNNRNRPMNSFVMIDVLRLFTPKDTTTLEPYEVQYHNGSRVLPVLLDRHVYAGICIAIEKNPGWGLRYRTVLNKQACSLIITNGKKHIPLTTILSRSYYGEKGRRLKASQYAIDSFLDLHPDVRLAWREHYKRQHFTERFKSLSVNTCWATFAYSKIEWYMVRPERFAQTISEMIAENNSKPPKTVLSSPLPIPFAVFDEFENDYKQDDTMAEIYALLSLINQRISKLEDK